ncbi:MAG: hypothetical protein EI684_17800 [Candidatus Viridilinea halotolerans]|uniref:Uncharacterized protein n=1 Tax=Candidatus Viridilinea halotolerans TaxID=2491704 RepID=A0A426TTU8_9CHLR|nr:MAG: hypothetical protein EI684_17800 [Candidatus Viridilinea halotolerans]
MGYTIPLALQDYMTVIFSGCALGLLTRMTWEIDEKLGRMALIGTGLALVGGLLKATGKLTLAAGGPDIVFMNRGLFVFVAPGFTLVGWALYQVRRIFRNQAPLRNPWIVPIAVIGVFALGSFGLSMVGGPWRVPLIMLATIANIGLLGMLVTAAWGRKMWGTGALFLCTITIVLVMSQMAEIENPSIATVWFMQLSQTLAQLLFTIGAWQYGKFMLATYREEQQQFVAQPA